MTAPLTLLIVEDETPLAEMHAEYIRHIPGFSQILLAGNLAQARMMIERFKPGLILLDNYLPDGRGLIYCMNWCRRIIPATWCLPLQPAIWKRCLKPYVVVYLIISLSPLPMNGWGKR